MFDYLKEVKQGKKDIRQFGIIFCVALCLWAGLLYWHGNPVFVYLLYAAGGFLALGLAAPLILKPFYLLWMSLAHGLGLLLTKLIMVVLFYFVMTPVGLLARLTGKKFLDTTFRTQDESYWIKRSREKKDRTGYEKQY